MSRYVMLMSTTTSIARTLISSLFVPLLFLALLFPTFSPAAKAQGVTVVEIGSEVVDHDQVLGPRWKRVNFEPLISGTHTIRVSWDNDAEIRFSLFQLLEALPPNDRVRIATSSGGTITQEWTGTLDESEQYYLGVWATVGSATFTATIEAETVAGDPLEITTQPADLTVTEGEDAIFTVAATGSGPLSYQWFADTIAISGAISDTLTISPATLTDSGTAYSVEITDDNGSMISDSATLTVNEVPVTLVVTGQPADLTVTEGEDAIFTVVATGSGTLSYQWFADAIAISGAISDTLTISPATLTDSGTAYSVEITDDNGSMISDSATLTVNEVPVTLVITGQPADLTVTEGEDAIFTVVATGSGTLSYQWFADTIAINGAISDTLTISPATLTDSGTAYSVEITDDNGSMTSDSATLTVNEGVVLPVTVVDIGQGILDSDKNLGPRWVQLDFDSLATAMHTITVVWDSDADVRFNVFEANGTRINSPVVQGANPGVWSGELNANEQYYIGLWSSDGIANYTATIEASVPVSIEGQPTDVILTEGEDAIFTVAAIGSGTLSYQWLADGIALPGESAASLTVLATTLADNGIQYTVEVSNGFEAITSDIATLTVNEVPVTIVIAEQPADLTITEGENAIFTVVATGSGTLNYQWFTGTTAISGAISDTLTISPATLADSGTSYSVEITDDNGSVNSDTVVLTVNEAPITVVIAEHPADLTVTEGEDAVFTVSATGSGALSYQWFSSTTEIVDGNTFIINPAEAIPGATSDTLLISTVTLADSLSGYSVVITDDNGSVTSDIAILTVDEALVTVSITAQPAELTVTEGEDAIFTVAATGSGTLGYQWFANTVAINGAISDTLTISPAALTDSGTTYSVVITDDNGAITSDTATLTVNEAPVEITEQPADLTVTEGEDATFTVAATGSGTLSYQWFADTIPISGAISDTLTISPATLADTGTAYSVVVSDDNGTIDSSIAILVVLEEVVLPVTVVEIGQGTLDSDATVSPRWVRLDFDALATAVHTITVFWDSDADVRFNVFEADGTRISSPAVQGSNPGVWAGELNANEQYYIALWSNSGIANYTATIEANVPVSIESQPTDLIVTEGEDATFTVAATGSGTLSYQWFADGVAMPGETADSMTVLVASLIENGVEYTVEVGNGFDALTSDIAVLTVNEPVVLGLFSQEADTSAWMLEGPAPTLDYQADENTKAWGRTLLRIGDILLVGGDFEGIKPTNNGPVTDRPFLAALNAVTGQPDATFQVPFQVDSVVRALVLSPSGNQVYVGGDFGFLVLDAVTGELDIDVSVTDDDDVGRVFDIAVTQTHVYIGGEFDNVDSTFRANVARLSLNGTLDLSWSPSVTNGFSGGRSAPVQAIAVSTSGDTVYIGGNFGFIDDTAVDRTLQNKKISLLAVSALDGTVQPERFSADIGNQTKALQVHDIAVTDFYVIVAWGGPNYVSFHSLAGNLLEQYRAKGDVQALQVVGDHVFVGHHGEFFGTLNFPNPPEAVVSIDPEIIEPFKFHSFRIDDPSFPPENAWQISGAFGVWGVAVAEDSIWLAGQIFRAGSNELSVDGLIKFSSLD